MSFSGTLDVQQLRGVIVWVTSDLQLPGKRVKWKKEFPCKDLHYKETVGKIVLEKTHKLLPL